MHETQVTIENIFAKLIISLLELFLNQKEKKISNKLKSKKIITGTINIKIFNDNKKSFVNSFFFPKAIVGSKTALIPFEIMLNFPVNCWGIELV